MDSFKNTLNALKTIDGASYYSLPSLEEQNIAQVSHLPISIRILLESLLRNCDGIRVKEEDVLRLARWDGKSSKGEVPFVVARVLLQDFTGVPLVVDLAAMRDAVAAQGKNPSLVEPLVPVDLVVDHSVQVDRAGTDDAYDFNLQLEFERNKERYEFLKWGEQAFKTFKVVPPGIGIVHQANLEYLASVVFKKTIEDQTMLYFDTLVGTDSHTTMVNGLGVVGWGVGGIEAQAAMLGQPVTLQMPEVIGVYVTGELQEGVTATDLVLVVTEMLRKEGVVNKFVEFFGEGVSNLTVADRATIGNMSPEYGATMGFFPFDEKTIEYLRLTGRDESSISYIKNYLEAQGVFGVHKKGDLLFSKTLDLDLSSIRPSVSGPKRPQDRITLPDVKNTFLSLLKDSSAKGYGLSDQEKNIYVNIQSDGEFSLNQPHEMGGIEKAEPSMTWSEYEMVTNRPFTSPFINPGYSAEHPVDGCLKHGSVVIAAITSCTNTSNPAVMIGAGLVAKKAIEKGLQVPSFVKTSLAPGSRVVTEYLKKAGLQKYLDQLGFQLVGYGCTTCIGNSGPLDEKIENAIKKHNIIAASVLSGNRNFEARIHSSVKANFLMSPPLVVAFAIAGRIDIDLEKEPLGRDKDGNAIFLKDLWPESAEIEQLIANHVQPNMFRARYSNVQEDNPLWKAIQITTGASYNWNTKSTYIQQPPYFENFKIHLPEKKDFKNMRCLAIFGDSVTTDHISPAGAFGKDSPAGQYLLSKGVKSEEFNSYGSRRGNHEVMLRGTFANVRIKNKMAEGKEGGYTKFMPSGDLMPIFDAAQKYAVEKIPLIIFAGKDYGMGSSRDWAAKGPALFGVQAVVAKSFERIHRSNLVGMGVLPLEFKKGDDAETFGIKGDELFSLSGIESLTPKQEMILEVSGKKIPLTLRIDTPIEVDYYLHGGIMPYVLRQLLKNN